MTSELIVAIISAGGAILGVGIGTAVSYLIARQQFRASVLSTNRQDWINALRDSLAEYQVLAAHASSALQTGQLETADQSSGFWRMHVLRMKIKLLLNPNEKDHDEIVQLLDMLLAEAPKAALDEESNRMGELQNRLTATAQKVLKREWERVKRGE